MSVVDLNTAIKQVKKWKTANQTVIFTNGCFDLIHRGHVEYLAKAKQLGDKLIIGLNSNESVTRLKGAGRPIQDESGRAIVIDALSVVNMVVIFCEDTPLKLIQALKPDVLVKGGDYNESNIVGAHYVRNQGGEVKVIPLSKGCGTSEIVRKIQLIPQLKPLTDH